MQYSEASGLTRAADRASLRGHSNMVRSLAYAPDGKTLASGSHDNTIKLWEVATGTERRQLNHKGAVRSLAVSHDSKTLASGSNDTTVKLWDLGSGEEQ